jgi:hypothetical protein
MALDSGGIAGLESGIGIVGLAGSIYGTLESSQAASAKAQEEKQIAGLEMQADQQRRQAMEISARRQQLQTVRSAQQAHSTALAVATNQGAQFGSGAAAGEGQASAQGAYANLGVSQNLQIGEKLFDINSQIDAAKMSEADAESKMASGQGISSIFGNLGKSAMSIGQLATLIP